MVKMKNDYLTFKIINSYNKRINDGNGNIITISVNIPQMSDNDLIKEVKSMCTIMNKARNIMDGKISKLNKALSATIGGRKALTVNDAERSFEKAFSILVKLNNEILLRGLSEKVIKFVQESLERKGRVDITLSEDDQILLT